MSKHIKRLKDDHKDFDYGDLGSDFESNPILAFQKWFDEACEKNESEPNAFCLSTIDETGKSPSSRIVYLKDLRNDECAERARALPTDRSAPSSPPAPPRRRTE